MAGGVSPSTPPRPAAPPSRLSFEEYVLVLLLLVVVLCYYYVSLFLSSLLLCCCFVVDMFTRPPVTPAGFAPRPRHVPHRSYLSSAMQHIPVSVKKHSSGEKDRWEDRLSEHQIRGWRAVSTAGLHDQGSHKRSVVLFTGTGIIISREI